LLAPINLPIQAPAVPTLTDVPATLEPTLAPTEPQELAATATIAPTNTLPPVVEVTATPNSTAIPVATLMGGGAGQVAFASMRSGVPQIYLVNLDLTDLTPLTNMDEGACQPTWSPDGSQIVFVSPCRARGEFFDNTYSNSSLYIMNADGSGQKPLTFVPSSDFDPDWSPDGKRITFTSLRSGNKDIYVLTLETGAIVRLTTVAGDIQENSQPSWSSLGNQIVYTVKRVGTYQVWVMSDNGQGNVQIVRSGQQFWDFLPIWAPDSETILFSQRNAGVVSRPWLMSIRYEDRDTKDPKRFDFQRPIEDVEFSPDGAWFVYEGMDNEGNRDIYIMTVSGGNRTRLTVDPRVDFDPTWRPIP
jgi:Tol biopolymer transport system component